MADPAAAERLRAQREAIVLEHMESENRHDFEATLATFDYPRYELVGIGTVYDGEDEVRRYYANSRSAFPDQRNVVVSVRHADDAVIVEFDLLGTHQGPLLGFEPTGKEFRCRMIALFLFPEDSPKIVCERVYFDSGSILGQLGLTGPAPSA